MKWKQLFERAMQLVRRRNTACSGFGYDEYRERSKGIMLAFRNGDLDETWIPIIEEATREEPYNFDMWLLLGIECFCNCQYDKAYIGLTQALRLCPSNLRALLLMGRLLATKRKDIKAAVYYLKKCQEYYPNEKYVMEEIAKIYFDAGLYKQALPLKEKLFDPDRYGDYFNLALCYYKTGKLKQAKSVCQRAIEKEPLFFGETDIRACGESERKEMRRLGQAIVGELSKRK